MGRLGLLVAAALIAAGFGTQQTFAQSGNNTEKGEKAEKQKSTEKKNAAKPSSGQTNDGKAAPMSGFRPDPTISY